MMCSQMTHCLLILSLLQSDDHVSGWWGNVRLGNNSFKYHHNSYFSTIIIVMCMRRTSKHFLRNSLVVAASHSSLYWQFSRVLFCRLFVCCCSFSRIFSAFHQCSQSPPCVDNVCWGGFRWHNRVGDYFLATFSWLKTGSVEDKCVWDDLYNVNMLINIMLIVTPPSLHQSAANT